MNFKRTFAKKHKIKRILLALAVSGVFLCQSCATIMSGFRTSQIIPVTSNPVGAKIIVDGKKMGYTPLNLQLKRKKSHVIQIEKQGYNPLDIRITRKSSLLFEPISGNIIWGPIGSVVADRLLIGWFNVGLGSSGKATSSGVFNPTVFVIGFVVGWTTGVGIDIATGANYSLSPKELNLRLIKTEGKHQHNFILINTEQFQNIKWIRIKCADSDREDGIVNLH